MEIGRWDEDELVRRCKQGSEAAYAELVRRHRPRLYSLAYRLIGDRETAEDCVQEAFVAAFRSIERFEPKPSLSAWLNTIVLHLAGRSAGRAEARSGPSLDALLLTDEGLGGHGIAANEANDPLAAAVASELRSDVAAAIRALPFNYRAAVVTRFVLGLDYAEGAASLEVGLNTYKSHLLRGTRLLREALGPHLAQAPAELPAIEATASSALNVPVVASVSLATDPASASDAGAMPIAASTVAGGGPVRANAVSTQTDPASMPISASTPATPSTPIAEPVRAPTRSAADRAAKTEFRQPAIERAAQSAASAGPFLDRARPRERTTRR